MLPSNLRGEWRWLSSGFLLMFFSGFGQTYYIAIFAGHLKTDLLLSDGQFGSLYTLGTLGSAALLGWAGKLADSLSVRWLGIGVITGLAVTAVAMSFVRGAWMLALAFFGLRFFAQGMLTHTAMTAMGRWFNRKRGQAVSIAGLGLPASEGLLPMFGVAIIALLGWRQAWLFSAFLIVVVAVPLLVRLLRHERHPTLGPGRSATEQDEPHRHHWSRGEALRNPLFYALMPVTLAMPFIATAIFINQVPLAASKDWQLSWFAASFTLLAVAHVVAALASGRLVDRFGARRLLPFYLLPLAFGTLLLVYARAPAALPVAMVLLGIGLGFASTTHGALWAELYGTEHLGGIRAIATSITVLATAVSPGLVGILMDAGIALESQMLVMALYCFAAALWTLLLRKPLERLANS